MLVAFTVDVEDPDHGSHGSPGDVTTILEALNTAEIRATFFVQGRWVAANPDVASAIGVGGHLVGNHSYYHTDTRLLTTSGIRQDITTAHQQIKDVLGIDARPWYRLPFGLGADSARIQRQLRALGYQHVGWDVGVRDFTMTDSDELVPAMSHELSELERAGVTHAIVLVHSWPSVTAQAMPELCRFLLTRCDGTVTVDQVPGHGAVTARASLGHRARALLSRTRQVLPHRT